MLQMKMLAAAAALAVSGGAVHSATLTLETAPAQTYQHASNNPCIISGVNCPQQPVGFGYTQYNNTGNMPSPYSAVSPNYTVGQVRALVGDMFSVGVDVNQTNANSPQTLASFTMSVNNSVVDHYVGSSGNVPALANGVGFADYLINGFTSLAGYSLSDVVSFAVTWEGLNDGPDSLFLVSNNAPAPVPLPASALLLAGGVGGLAALRRRKKAA